MNKYRRRVVEYEAVLLSKENSVEVAKWCDGCRTKYGMIVGEGARVMFGMWIIRDENDVFFATGNDTFHRVYEQTSGNFLCGLKKGHMV
jgi:hypothetical protein